jgi:hypothetical protein
MAIQMLYQRSFPLYDLFAVLYTVLGQAVPFVAADLIAP